MKTLIVVENFVMDGVKRVTSVLGNRLSKETNIYYYSLADIESFYPLKAPLIIARHPIDSHGISFRGDHPLDRFKTQINDLIDELSNGNYDSVILTAGLLTSFIPKIKRKIPHIRAIAWMHNNVDTYLNNYYIHMQKEFTRGLNAADTVVVLTEYDLLGFLPYNLNTIKIYNPLTIVAPKTSTLMAHNIAFTGRIDIRQKGIDFLIEFASLLPDDWHLSIAGDGRELAMKEFDALIAKHHAQQNVNYQGRLKDQKLIEHYLNASLFVMTSRWEGLPLVLGEAMSFGLPVATMYSTGADEYLAGGEHGILLDNHDPHNFLNAVTPLLNDISVRKRYADKSRKRAQDFEMATVIQEWQKILGL